MSKKNMAITTKRSSDGSITIDFSLLGHQKVVANIDKNLEDISFENVDLDNIKLVHVQFYFQIMSHIMRTISKMKEVKKGEES